MTDTQRVDEQITQLGQKVASELDRFEPQGLNSASFDGISEFRARYRNEIKPGGLKGEVGSCLIPYEDPEALALVSIERLPQLNYEPNMFVPNTVCADSDFEDLVEKLNAEARNLKGGTMSVASISSETSKHDSLLKAGFIPFCDYPLIDLSALPAQTSSELSIREADIEDAEAMARMFFEYKLRRSELRPEFWTLRSDSLDEGKTEAEVHERHIQNQAAYFRRSLLPEDKASRAFVIEDEKELLAAGIGSPIKSELAPLGTLSYSPKLQFLQLDDFYVRMGENWEAPALLMLQKLAEAFAEQGVTLGLFVNNEIDKEMRDFAASHGAVSLFQFHTKRIWD